MIPSQSVCIHRVLAVLLCLVPGASLQAKQFLQVISEPNLAIHLNGEFKGVTSAASGGLLIEDIEPGVHFLEATRPGYESHSEVLVVAPDEVNQVFVPQRSLLETRERLAGAEPLMLSNQPGKLTIRSRPTVAEINIPSAGILQASKTGNVWSRWFLPAGRHLVTVSSMGRSLSREVVISSAADAELLFDFDRNVVVDQSVQEDLPLAGFASISPSLSPGTEGGPAPSPASSTTFASDLSDPEFPSLIMGPHGIELVRIDPGTYLKGSPPGEWGRDDSEYQKTVTIGERFYLSRYEITRAQWAQVMGSFPDPPEDAPELPVRGVAVEEILEFILRLNRSTPWIFRLPTEEEWEYACRAATKGPFSADLQDSAWFLQNSGNTPHPVGLRQPNPWGLYDMHGNVAELTVRPNALGRPDYPVRGGSYASPAARCRSAARLDVVVYAPESRIKKFRSGELSPETGFRLAREISGPNVNPWTVALFRRPTASPGLDHASDSSPASHEGEPRGIAAILAIDSPASLDEDRGLSSAFSGIEKPLQDPSAPVGSENQAFLRALDQKFAPSVDRPIDRDLGQYEVVTPITEYSPGGLQGSDVLKSIDRLIDPSSDREQEAWPEEMQFRPEDSQDPGLFQLVDPSVTPGKARSDGLRTGADPEDDES